MRPSSTRSSSPTAPATAHGVAHASLERWRVAPSPLRLCALSLGVLFVSLSLIVALLTTDAATALRERRQPALSVSSSSSSSSLLSSSLSLSLLSSSSSSADHLSSQFSVSSSSSSPPPSPLSLPLSSSSSSSSSSCVVDWWRGVERAIAAHRRHDAAALRNSSSSNRRAPADAAADDARMRSRSSALSSSLSGCVRDDESAALASASQTIDALLSRVAALSARVEQLEAPRSKGLSTPAGAAVSTDGDEDDLRCNTTLALVRARFDDVAHELWKCKVHLTRAPRTLRTFVHIPKAGGTTFKQMLDHAARTHRFSMIGHETDFLALDARRQAATSFIFGHRGYGVGTLGRAWFKDPERAVVSMALIREPLARSVSQWKYDMSCLPARAGKVLSFEQYYERKKNDWSRGGNAPWALVGNPMVFQLAHYFSPMHRDAALGRDQWHVARFRPMTRDDLELAKRHIMRMPVIGDLGSGELAFRMIAWLYEWHEYVGAPDHSSSSSDDVVNRDSKGVSDGDGDGDAADKHDDKDDGDNSNTQPIKHANRFGCRAAVYQSLDVNVSDELRRTIAADLSLDVELYAFARRWFARQVEWRRRWQMQHDFNR